MFHGFPCTLRDTSISPATDVCLTLQNTRHQAFDCTLSGPFDDLFFTRFTAPRALCGIIITFTSASTVYIDFCHIISLVFSTVNRFFYFSEHWKNLRIFPFSQNVRCIFSALCDMQYRNTVQTDCRMTAPQTVRRQKSDDRSRAHRLH